MLCRFQILISFALGAALVTCASMTPSTTESQVTRLRFDIVIRDGWIIDGSGQSRVLGDIAVSGDRIAEVGTVKERGRIEIDATGLVVAPGFINMLSGGFDTLVEDGRAQSDLRQGVTTEVTGEGWSLGPWHDEMRAEAVKRQWDKVRYAVQWTSLREGLQFFVDQGIAPNLASFVGATTVRRYVLGHEDREPTPDELRKMQQLVREAMEDGALGLGSSLIYAPAFYAKTEELVALAKIAAEYDGIYISHLRSEGNKFLEALDEFLTIVKEADVRGEVYHLKAAGEANWAKLTQAIETMEAARKAGLRVSANMYPYPAAQASLGATMPPWVQEGGHDAWIERLKKPEIRAKVLKEMTTPSGAWENFYLLSGSPDRIVPVGFKTEQLKALSGKTLAEIAAQRGTDPAATIIDLTIEDNNRIQSVYYLMSDANVRRKIELPWISFGSDAAAFSIESEFAKLSTHPRAYGTFARVLGHFVRDEEALSLEEAVRRMTSLPAGNLRLDRRGLLKKGYFADIAIFDPAAVKDNATYVEPHQYASGTQHVFVNGVHVLKNGEPTGKPAGRVLSRVGAAKNKQ